MTTLDQPPCGPGSIPLTGQQYQIAAGQYRTTADWPCELIEAAIPADIGLFDTSPMYGDAERLLAGALDGQRDQVLLADKIWIPSLQESAAQLARAASLYGGHIDLMQL